jgi:hypothetical protein
MYIYVCVGICSGSHEKQNPMCIHTHTHTIYIYICIYRYIYIYISKCTHRGGTDPFIFSRLRRLIALVGLVSGLCRLIALVR